MYYISMYMLFNLNIYYVSMFMLLNLNIYYVILYRGEQTSPPPHLPGSRNPDYIQQQKIGN